MAVYTDLCTSSGKTIWFDYPESAAQEDVLLKDNLSSKRKVITLDKNSKLADLEHYVAFEMRVATD